MVKRYDFIGRNDEFQMEYEGEPRESKTGKYVLYSDYEAHNWMADHGQKLRNAIADCIPLGEPCGDQDLINYPAKMNKRLQRIWTAYEAYINCETDIPGLLKTIEEE